MMLHPTYNTGLPCFRVRQSTDHAVLRSPVRPFGTLYHRLFATETSSKTTEDVSFLLGIWNMNDCLRALRVTA